MTDVIGLVMPFFGLIFVGFVVARITRQPIEALGWMTTFVIYVALPALFFQLLAKTPFERLTEWSFIFGSVFSTFTIFSDDVRRLRCCSPAASIADSTIKGLAAAYGNIGYMGPGLALLAFGDGGGGAGRADLLLRKHHAFRDRADDDGAVGRRASSTPLQLALGVHRQDRAHPFIIATAAGVLAAYFQFRPPVPVERFLEYLSARRSTLRAVRHGRDAGAAAAEARAARARADRAAEARPCIRALLCRAELRSAISPKSGCSPPCCSPPCRPPPTSSCIAQQYGVWVQRASASILITTLLRSRTVTGLLYLSRRGMLPPDLFP